MFFTDGWKSDFMLLESMLYYADVVSFLNPVTNVSGQDHGMVKCVHVQLWSVGKQ